MTMNDYLVNAEISLLERKLNLKESVGFNPNDYPYLENWGNKTEHELLLSKASKVPTLVGIIEDDRNKCSYKVTILYHEGRYVTLVKEVNGTKFSINSTESYLRALEFAQVEVLILSLNERDN